MINWPPNFSQCHWKGEWETVLNASSLIEYFHIHSSIDPAMH